MEKEKFQIPHYLSLSYKVLINKNFVHYILFLFEIYLILMRIMEIFWNDFKLTIINDNINKYNPLTNLLCLINNLQSIIKFIIYLVVIIILNLNILLLNFFRFKVNIFTKVIINLSELFFFRVLCLFLFNYLFIFKGLFLIINGFFTITFVISLIFNFYLNNLFLFFPSLVNYPYDSFSMIIDLHLLIMKIFLSISGMIEDENISKFCFIASILILFILLFYLSYLMIYKSYYLMNNCHLNKIKFSIILGCCFMTILVITIDKADFTNIFYTISYCNIALICILFICYFYDPYQFSKFGRDDCIENVYYYFFILDRDKNNYFLLEEKIGEHISKCNRCNLCKKYNYLKTKSKNGEIDLFNIISNNDNIIFNTMNKIIRAVRKYGRNNFVNNYFYLINIIYIYCMAINQKNYNIILNVELLYEIINSENSQLLDDYEICLNQIKYANSFFIKANEILDSLYTIFEEKNPLKKSLLFLETSELLDNLKYKEIKKNSHNNFNNYNGNNIEGLPNCNKLLTICSIFYEELYNEPISNSGIYIRDSPNLLDDLFNNNYEDSREITFEIEFIHFKMNIIRAGGHMNKYENKNLFELFPSIFKNRQILEIKKIVLNSNDNKPIRYKRNSSSQLKKSNDKEKKYIRLNFIIEEKEDNEIFYRKLKLKLSLILLTNINTSIFLNGIYSLDSDIVVTEKYKKDELILHFGNSSRNNKYLINNENLNNLTIKTRKNEKYLKDDKLIKDSNSFVGCKVYSVYHFSSRPILNEKNKQNTQQSSHKEKYSSNGEQKIILINDVASQSSLTNHSIPKNNFSSNYKVNKNAELDQKVTNKFNIAKLLLLIIIAFFFLLIILQSIFLITSHQELETRNKFYILVGKYKTCIDTLFFSILSLVCIAESNNSYNCSNYMNDITMASMIYNYLIEIINKDLDNIDMKFLNFTELIFNQNKILYNNLDNILANLTIYLSSFDGNGFMNSFKSNVPHYKINQNMKNNNITISLSKEDISFSDFLLLMTSRFGILTNDINDIIKPIYILNKTGNNAFNNVYAHDKLSSYQENIYLMILDYKTFSSYLELVNNEIGYFSFIRKATIKRLIYIFVNLNLFVLIVILIILLGYICLYLIVIFKILDDVYIDIRKKMGDVLVKDIFIKKIDNLRLLLKFFENDINKTMSDLNDIYNDYHEKYNIKLKEESKLFRKEGKNEIQVKRKKIGCIKLMKIFWKFKLYKYTKRKKLYAGAFLFYIIVVLSIYFIILFKWIFHFKKDDAALKWVDVGNTFSSQTSKLMNNFLIMFLNNQTLADISSSVEGKDYINYIYSKLTDIYQGDKFFFILNDIPTINDYNINFDCKIFYQTLNNELFDELKNKYKNETEKLYYTMHYFCEWSNVMMFKRYKTIYLQLFQQVKIIMENFNNNDSYDGIIKSINSNDDIGRIEIIYLITYIYLIDVINSNIKIMVSTMMERMGNNIISTAFIYIIMLIILSIVLYFIYLRNINKDFAKFIQVKKVFKVCNTNE